MALGRRSSASARRRASRLTAARGERAWLHGSCARNRACRRCPPTSASCPDELCDYASARVAVLPVPFERTTSYGKGTAGGPAAILRASQSMEL